MSTRRTGPNTTDLHQNPSGEEPLDTIDLSRDPTERLMELLASVSDPDSRGQALVTMTGLPPEFWDRERLEGTWAILVPVAEDTELDESTAFTLWTLMATLLARFEAITGERAADTFLDALGGLLEAEIDDIRGFAASAIAQSSQEEATSLLLSALSQERAWDVAIRLITGLEGRDTRHVPSDIFARLLDAPTTEACTWAAHQLGERGDPEVRGALYTTLHRSPSVALQEAVTKALELLDLVHAQRFALQLPEAQPQDDTTTLILDRNG
ncbi:MAG: hypothetical protein AAFX99_21965, partial [Myxococcota bacterium]